MPSAFCNFVSSNQLACLASSFYICLVPELCIDGFDVRLETVGEVTVILYMAVCKVSCDGKA